MAFQHAVSHHNLGLFAEAAEVYQQILQADPNCADAMHLLGLSYLQRGAIGSADECIRKAINTNPTDANYHNNLGLVCRMQGETDKAAKCFESALQIDPNLAEAHSNLGNVMRSKGMLADAISCYISALKIRDVDDAKSGFAQSIIAAGYTGNDATYPMFVTRAISEGWASPEDLLSPALSAILQDSLVRKCVAIAKQKLQRGLSEQELFGNDGLAKIAENALLEHVMKSVPVANAEMEGFLTKARFVMLQAAINTENTSRTCGEDNHCNPQRFYFTLAQQCFINEYAFYFTEGERSQFEELCKKISSNLLGDRPIPDIWLAAAAAYAPLNAVQNIERLLDLNWPDYISELLNQQVKEVSCELELREQMPRLTEISDEISVLVKTQYEESPYPRWVALASTPSATTLDVYFRQQLPYATSQKVGNRRELDVLVAGCGTGRHAISTALSFAEAKVLAVDLSLASLGYAKRKTLDLGLNNINYAQADILKLGDSGLTFDVIECAGVLHHLADPAEGLRVLEKLLRPGGVMCLGLYSELGRADVVAARRYISASNYGTSACDIREFRHKVITHADSIHFNSVLAHSDFYSISGIRDFLFHVQEHRYTIPKIKDFLKEFGLTFVFFDIHPTILFRYLQRYPDDPNGINLNSWHSFETENPNTFSGMYQFWVQKPI